MKVLSKLLSVLLLAFLSAASQAQNYYVCDTGDDANDGKSEATPFKTYEKGLNTFNKMFAGDSVLFCRGGVFHGSQQVRLYNSKCGTEKVCTIADYGDSNKDAPIIKAENITAFLFANGGDAVPDGGYVVRNLTLISNAGTSGSGISFFNDVNDVLIDNVHIESFRIGIHAAGANHPVMGSNQANDNIVVKNSTVINNSSQGWLGGCNDCLIENNHFENNGYGRKLMDHNIYIDSPIKSQKFYNKNITIRNNTLLQSTRIDGECAGVSLVVHGIIKDLTIEGNLIKEEKGKVSPFCWGIGIDPGNSLDESFVGVTIRNNTLFNVGNVAIGCASCKDVLIEGNLIIDEGDVLRAGISIPNKQEDSLKSENVTISNNIIAINNIKGEGIYLNTANKFLVFENTISILRDTPNSQCIKMSSTPNDIDVSNNKCLIHDNIKINYDLDTIDTLLSDYDESFLEDSENTPPPPTESVPEDFENIENENSSESEIDNSENIEIPSESVTEFIESISPSLSQQETIASPIDSKSSLENIIPISPFDFETDGINSNSKTRNASNGGGSSSGGGSSRSAKTPSTDLSLNDDVISYTTSTSSLEPSTNIMSVENDEMEISKSLPKSDPESSKYSVKIKDVMEASRQNNDELDVTKCRAYAAGRCLMK